MIGQRGIPDAGGIERHVEELGARLAASGHDVIVYCRQHSAVRPAMYRGIRLVTLWTVQQKHSATLVHSFLATLDGLRRGVDLFHYHAIGPGVLAPLPRFLGRKVVTTVHALDWQRAKWGWLARQFLRLSERLAVRFSHRTIAVSRSIAEYLRATYGVEPVYIPNGAKPALRDSTADETVLRGLGVHPGSYLLFVGRLVPEKGCHYLIEAFRREQPPLDLLIVGAPTFTDSYAARLRTMAPPGVRFLEPVAYETLSVLYRHAYACVVPSDLEGLSQVLLEMMVHGRCVIASDIPANAEVLQEGGDVGRLFPAGDVEALAGALRWAITNPGEVERLGRNARHLVQSAYSWPRVARLTDAVYRSVLGVAGPAAGMAVEETGAPQ